MITGQNLRELINIGNETEEIDFKSEAYDIHNPDKRIANKKKEDFLKDVISMANTPRESSAYIILGVKLDNDGTRELIGIATHVDDADLQPLMDSLKLSVRPQFVYQPVNLDGTVFGVIEISIEKNKRGPFIPGQHHGSKIRKNTLYFRRGTTNQEADYNDTRQIENWFESLKRQQFTPIDSPSSSNHFWSEFELACHNFDPSRRYLWILGPDSTNASLDWTQLAKLPLSIVLDFDPNSSETGVYSKTSEQMKQQRSLHLWTAGNVAPMVPEKACYWYEAKGIISRPNTLSNGYRAWNREYGRKEIPQLISEFAKSADGRLVTVICTWYAPQYIRDVCSAIDVDFLDIADYVFAIPESERYEEISSSFDGRTISIEMSDILQGIARTMKNDSQTRIPSSIPMADNGKYIIEPARLNWLAEDFDVLYEGIEATIIEDDDLPHAFLQGNTISWADLSQHRDAERDLVNQLQNIVEADLKNRGRTRVNLYHIPGAGGTTVARRIAWNMHRKYPTIQLRRIETQETVHKINYLFQETKNPILILVEGVDIISAELDRLYDELQNANIAFVFLIIRRTFRNITPNDRVRALNQRLNNTESFDFLNKYKLAATSLAANINLEKLHETRERTRTPFSFAFTSFGEDYMGIESYVTARMNSGNIIQREILTFIALAYYYGHKPILSQVFAAHLGVPEHKKLRLESHLTDIQRDLLLEDSDCLWRPIHQEIAKQILVSSLSGSDDDPRNWKRYLPKWGSDFIIVCSRGNTSQSDALVDLVRRVTILRDENEILGTESAGHNNFGALVEDIQTDEGRLSVLEALVKAFPDEAHFAGHLGRFYSITMGDTENALKHISRAISLEPDDSVLHHMQGMIYRKRASDYSYNYRTHKDQSPNDKKKLFEYARTAIEHGSEAFAKARELNPNTEHPYISEIQMILSVLDNMYIASEASSRVQFFSQKTTISKWCQELIDDAESLLDLVMRAREGEEQSSYVRKVRADLDAVYDNYSLAIEGWSNLIGQKNVFNPPLRRQIARAYLARKRRDWSALTQREINRIVELMEDNLREEPRSERNIRLWFRATRHSDSANINLAIDRIANWRTTGDTIDAYYYLYILHAIKALDGALLETVKTQDYIRQCATRARNLRYRTRSYEWLGYGQDIQRLINATELGNWNKDIDFYENTEKLAVVEATIKRINAPESGVLEILGSGLEVFFVPARAKAVKGRDENARVNFFLGFSYDGLRAWSVELL